MPIKKIRTAIEAAIDLIEPYVKTESLEHLKHSYMGACHDEYWAQISGELNGKKYGSDYIVVFRVGKKECAEVFKIKDVYEYVNQSRRSEPTSRKALPNLPAGS